LPSRTRLKKRVDGYLPRGTRREIEAYVKGPYWFFWNVALS
jgi:hypothetical protein